MTRDRIYLDHNATSPLRPEVRSAIEQFLTEPGANPSSIHTSGRRIRKKLDDARETVARFLGASASEVVFTSGGTEANRLAWNVVNRGEMRALTSQVEHPCVLGAASRAEHLGATVQYIRTNRQGRFDPAPKDRNFDFVSLQLANQETGIAHPISEVLSSLQNRPTVIHTDAVQGLGKMRINVRDLGVDLISISGHKIGAPAGIGALVIKKGVSIEPLWSGGHQEREQRPGTENAVGIVGFAAAIQVLENQFEREATHLMRLRDAFEGALLEQIPEATVTGTGSPRLPNTAHICFPAIDGEALLIAADLAGIDCSMGSACSSGSLKPSPVLLAMGFTPEEARRSIRFSFGWNTTENEVQRAAETLPRLVRQVQKAQGKEKR